MAHPEQIVVQKAVDCFRDRGFGIRRITSYNVCYTKLLRLLMDETTVQVLDERDKSNTSKSYMWVQRGFYDGKPIVITSYSIHYTKLYEAAP